MNTVETKLITTAIFSDDGKKRYLLRKEWDASKPRLLIVMLAPSGASGIELDSTTLLVLNNSSRLGYGSVSIVNLFATLNDHSLSCVEDNDVENTKIIVEESQNADAIVYAPGVGKSKNLAFQTRTEQILKELKPFQKKLKCITNKDNTVRLVHPLTPSVRIWYLSDVKINEIIEKTLPSQKTKKRPPACIRQGSLIRNTEKCVFQIYKPSSCFFLI